MASKANIHGAGAVRKVSASELKNAWHEHLDRVSQGHEEIVVTRYGKPVAKLVPYEEVTRYGNPVAKLVPYEEEGGQGGIFGSLARTKTVRADIVASVGEEWEADA